MNNEKRIDGKIENSLELEPIENPFEDPYRINFPPLTNDIFKSDKKSLKSISEEEHFRWSIEHIAELNPVNIELTDRHIITDDSTYREVQKQVDNYFSTLVLPSPWTPATKTISSMQQINDRPPQSPSQFSDTIVLTPEEKLDQLELNERSFQTDVTLPFDINLGDFLCCYPFDEIENKEKKFEVIIEDSFYSFASTPTINHKKSDFMLPTGSGKDASVSFPDFLSPVNSTRTVPIPLQPFSPCEKNNLSTIRMNKDTPTFSNLK